MIDDVLDHLRVVVDDAADGIHRAADAIVATGRAGGLVRPAGAGHSLAAVLETFFRAGGLLGAGSDPCCLHVIAGYGDQRNFELLIEAGFTPGEAVQVMTLNGARILGIEKEAGSIERGKQADLVVLRGNPAASAADIRNVVTVFRKGIGYDSAKLIGSVKGQIGIK